MTQEKQTKLIPFDLEKAINGEPLITRDGRNVDEFYYFKTSKSNQPLKAVINGTIYEYSLDGKYVTEIICNHDLFMKPKVLKCWVNIFSDGKKIWIGGAHWDNEKDAKCFAENINNYIKTIRITNEK